MSQIVSVIAQRPSEAEQGEPEIVVVAKGGIVLPDHTSYHLSPAEAMKLSDDLDMAYQDLKARHR